MRTSCSIAAAALAAGLAASAAAQASSALKAPTIDQSLETESVFSPRISPDGKRVVYGQGRLDWDKNEWDTDLWIADITTGDHRPLTVMSGTSANPAWSPDGRWIAFLSDRPGYLKDSPSGKRQLYIIRADGGEAQQLTKMENGVNALDWSPDSAHIAISAEGPEPKPMKDRKDYFGDYRVIHADYQMTHLWLVDLPTADASGRYAKPGDPKALTKGDTFSVDDFSYSPDGKRIAFSATRDPDIISGDSSDIYTVTVPEGAVKKIVDTPFPDGNPHWSPDGKQIAYNTANGSKYYYYTDQRIAVVPADGGTPQVLTEKFDEDPNLLRWAPEGIYFSAQQKTNSALFVLDPATKAIRQIDLPGTPIASQFTFSSDFSHVAYRGSAPNQFGEIYASAIDSPAPVKLTRAADQLSGFTQAHREVIRWKSGDGTEIEGILLKPADFDAHKKYPLLVIIHGGPTGVDQPDIGLDRYYPIERFVARGALILRPNYRGSAGYGEAFRSLNVRNLGVGDYADVISGVDYLIGQGFVEKDRVGSMGWSEGGYISAFITASSNRFKAVSVGAGISDWMTYYANTDITPFTRQYLHATPWEDPDIYAKTSPIHYIAKAQTPTLIQQGSNDRRVPVPDSFELRQALEDRGIPVKMVLYEGFGHGINKPKQQRAVMEENENWFDHYIWGDPLAPSLTPVVTPKPAEK
ncbi:MAG TPA: S9 family peptidase [Terracidiphilus sp.]|nr:S9 family peptidase [Terracidiphilus sp.]